MWETDKQKLLCHMLVNDKYAKILSPLAGGAFWRAFIVQDRVSGRVKAMFRFKYEDHSNWFEMNPSDQGETQAVIAKLRCSLEDVLMQAVKIMLGMECVPEDFIECFYPPDDGGDPQKTIQWLLERDLIEVRSIEEET